jgi:glycosyltransferase involved in cell wall biosynthesis
VKIALVSINAWPLIGGLEKLGHRLAQTLEANGDQCQFITRFCEQRRGLAAYFSDSEPGRCTLIEGVETDVIPLRWWERLLWIPLFRLIWRPITFPWAVALHNLVMVPNLLQRLKGAQVVHFLGSGPELLGFAAAEAARRLRLPLVVEPALHPGQWGDSWIDLRLYQQAERVLAHSQAERLVLQQLGIAQEHIQVITHGVDRLAGGNGERFRRRHRIPANAPLILFLGRQTREKGVFRVLQAFHTVQQKSPDALLVLAGPAHGDLVVGGTPGVIRLNHLSEADKQDALAACTLLCVPSEGESFGLVYYEAWQYAKPVVALDLPSLRESIAAHRAGLLVSPEHPQALAEALFTLLQDPALAAAMGQRGQALAQCHSWDQAIRSYQDVYRQLVSA